jgi:hypothetical protein
MRAALFTLLLPVLSLQAAPPAANLVTFRRQQVYGASTYTWSQFQDGAIVHSFPLSTAITVPAGQHLVVTGIRYWFTATASGNIYLGQSAGGIVSNEYMKLLNASPSGALATQEGFEHFTTGMSFASGTLVDIKVTKTGSDTVVWFYLYGYLEAN